jgi:hypothetical protein
MLTKQVQKYAAVGAIRWVIDVPIVTQRRRVFNNINGFVGFVVIPDYQPLALRASLL